MSEGNGAVWRYLLKVLPPQGHYTRIESRDTAPGFPDVHYTLESVTGTIELKDAKRPGAKYPFSGDSGLRANQIRWMREQIDNADGRVVLALQCGDRVYILNAALYYDELHQMTEEDIQRCSSVNWIKGKITDTYTELLRIALMGD